MRGPDDEEEGDVDYYSSLEDDERVRDPKDIDLDEMKRNHPGYSEESYRTGKMLGVDFPYVPGDPFW